MGQWTRVENNDEVFLRVTNHTGQVEKNLLMLHYAYVYIMQAALQTA